MTTLCMADYTEPPIRATDILRNPKLLWGALRECASTAEGAELAGILRALSEHSVMVHRLINDIASRDIELEAAARRERAALLAQKWLKQERPQRAGLQSVNEAAAPSVGHGPMLSRDHARPSFERQVSVNR